MFKHLKVTRRWVCLGLHVSKPNFMTKSVKQVTTARERKKEGKQNNPDGEWLPQKRAQRKSKPLVCVLF